MKTFEAQLYDLKKKMFQTISLKLNAVGVPSKFNFNCQVITVDDEDFQFTLQDDRYLIEVGSVLVDNKGYTHAIESLPLEQLIKITDYILNL